MNTALRILSKAIAEVDRLEEVTTAAADDMSMPEENYNALVNAEVMAIDRAAEALITATSGGIDADTARLMVLTKREKIAALLARCA